MYACNTCSCDLPLSGWCSGENNLSLWVSSPLRNMFSSRMVSSASGMSIMLCTAYAAVRTTAAWADPSPWSVHSILCSLLYRNKIAAGFVLCACLMVWCVVFNDQFDDRKAGCNDFEICDESLPPLSSGDDLACS
jgi:hypothetical protein